MTLDEQIDRSNAIILRTLKEERRKASLVGDLTAQHCILIDRILAAWNDDRAEREKDPLSRVEAITLVLQALAELVGVETTIPPCDQPSQP